MDLKRAIIDKIVKRLHVPSNQSASVTLGGAPWVTEEEGSRGESGGTRPGKDAGGTAEHAGVEGKRDLKRAIIDKIVKRLHVPSNQSASVALGGAAWITHGGPHAGGS